MTSTTGQRRGDNPAFTHTKGRRLRRAAFTIGTSLAVVLGLAGAAPAAPATPASVQSAAAKADMHDGPWIGTWQRRNATPGGDVWTLKMWKEGDGIRYTLTVKRPDGTPTPTHMEAWVRFDGKPYPEKGNASADHNVFDRIDDHTLRLTDVKDGKATIQFTITYSQDGKVRTSVSSRVNDKGETTTSTGVWDRVS